MIKRKLFLPLKKHLLRNEISLIVGPRQAGKTTMMLFLKRYLQDKGAKTLFLSLDFESDRPHFSSQRSLINKLRLEFGDKKGYVFIDEIQRKENAGLFLKGIYDLKLPYKFIVSGSGSLELKEKIHESLAGRKRLFELSTLSFDEFIDFKTDYGYSDKLSDLFSVEEELTRELLREYLNFGGYPKVVLEAELQEKIQIIDEIYRSYLERDIAYFLNIGKIDAFSSLVRILASQIGQIINFSELSSTIGISAKTVKNYFWFLQKTFILHEVKPFFRNIRKEIKKSPVCYFYDLGLRNYAVGLFGNIEIPGQTGFLFQNMIYNLLKDHTSFSPVNIHFWRTKDKAEVDFILDFGPKVIPIEVKYKDLKRPTVGKSLRSFIKKYEPQEAWIVNLNYKTEIKLEQTIIKFMPFYELIVGLN